MSRSSVRPFPKWPLVEDDEIEAVVETLKSGVLTTGPKREEFERKFAEYHRVPHAVSASSGTAAIHLALMGLGIGPGDEAIVPAYTFIGTVTPVIAQGAMPVFADVDLDTFNINPSSIEERITSRTKAIMVVHLYGLPANMKEIMDIASDSGITVIEDCAQSPGAEYNKRKVGTIGHVGCFSFQQSKNMFTGEGGMLISSDEGLSRKARAYRHQGGFYTGEKWPRIEVQGLKYELTEMQAALGIVQLTKLDYNNSKRIRNAELLTRMLSGRDDIILPSREENVKHVYHVYAIRLAENLRKHIDEIVAASRERGIPVGRGYVRPLYREPIFEKRVGKGRTKCPWDCHANISSQHSSESCPNTERLCQETLLLPVYPTLSTVDIEQMAQLISNILERMC